MDTVFIIDALIDIVKIAIGILLAWGLIQICEHVIK